MLSNIQFPYLTVFLFCKINSTSRIFPYFKTVFRIQLYSVSGQNYSSVSPKKYGIIRYVRINILSEYWSPYSDTTWIRRNRIQESQYEPYGGRIHAEYFARIFPYSSRIRSNTVIIFHVFEHVSRSVIVPYVPPKIWTLFIRMLVHYILNYGLTF